MIRIIDSPREAFQGFSGIIPTEDKVRYINLLMQTGFDTVETGSLASAALIPQLADSSLILDLIDKPADTNLMMLSVSLKSAEKIAFHPKVTHIAYPHSISPSFLYRNLKTTGDKSLENTAGIVDLCDKNSKTPVIYISMAFGNPYHDPWSPEMLTDHVARLVENGAHIITLSNVSVPVEPDLISEIFSTLMPLFPEIEIGLHLHTTDDDWYEKVNAAWEAGCRRFDGVLQGLGGCPMTGDELLPNLKTENLVKFAERNGVSCGIDMNIMEEAVKTMASLFKN